MYFVQVTCAQLRAAIRVYKVWKFTHFFFSYSYSIDGLSAAGLRVMLQPVNQDGKPEGFIRELWSTRDSTSKAWQEAQTLYTYNKDHKVSVIFDKNRINYDDVHL